jgi:flavin-dependent dehydrogenase
MKKLEYIIMGGGVAGLTLACLLAKKGKPVCLIEKSTYPRHKVCGEYLSNEVLPFLQENNLFPEAESIPDISRFHLSDLEGNLVELDLDLGGFGISRYTLDYYLYEQAVELGVEFRLNEKVTHIEFEKNQFNLQTNRSRYQASWLIGAFGKRSVIDKILNRPFMQKRSPYLGVKYHVMNPSINRDTVALHNFKGGYCGVNAVEEDRVNICYLAHRDSLRNAGKIPEMERSILFQNPRIREVFESSEMLWERPEVINEISFETKSPVEDHILMCGDAAGMITPLCGNGMAIAMHSAKLLSDVLLKFPDHTDRSKAERMYTREWSSLFKNRLSAGRLIQRFFGRGKLSGMTVRLGKSIPAAGHWLMKQTHGKPFGQ